ncbi:hypothetical protein TWF788_006755 [Orbilia oligospora]|uniref:Uncharacterized protein n=1 Tax=Orbilia oligospora TaxID=2813651 RepID=A0A7C8PVC5_ORBOL|nr:hypothetical protein TWF788_006755 [Orbilia oligospora]
MLMGELLTCLLMASAALAYEMAFLEELGPEMGEFDPEGAIWNRYNNGIGCTEIPPNPSGYVEEIIIRVARNEPEPPALMAFFDNEDQAGSPPRSGCNIQDIVFIVHWYEMPSSQRVHYTFGTITHFSEVRRGSNLERFVQSLADRTAFLHEGDRASLDREPGADREWKVVKDDIEFSPVPYIGIGAQDPLYDPRSPSMESEYIEEPGAPLRLGNSMSNEIEIEIERAPDGNSSAGLRSDETDPFEEMYFFERNQPNFWISLAQQLGEVRDAAMAAGLYIPIPLGLRSRYSGEDLNALGLTIDPEAEEEILRDLADPTRLNPDIANVMIRPIYQIFTGSYPGIWNYLLEGNGWAAENESQIVEMSEIDLLAPGRGSERSASQNVGENSDMLGSRQPVQPGNYLSNDPVDRRAIASEDSMEFEEEASPPSFRWEGSNLDANAECLINDICIEDTP